jgi:hypothetical protein
MAEKKGTVISCCPVGCFVVGLFVVVRWSELDVWFGGHIVILCL